MKYKINPHLLFVSSLITLTAPVTFADTIASSADLRVMSGLLNGNDASALSLYHNPYGNEQRTFLNFNLSSYSGKSVTSDATLTLTAGIYGNILTGVSLGTANSAWNQAGITWNNQPGLTPIAGATNPDGTFGSGPVTWTIPWYMVEKLTTTGSGYNNGLGITSGVGSDQHFQSTASGGPAPSLTFSAATAASSAWTGGNGNWTDTANWAGATVAEGINQTATINGGTAVNITMVANRSVGALSFSGADHTISSGSGKLALNVTSGAPTVTVETGRIATIGATVVGIDGLTKSGLGTLTLTGANTYTGATTVTAGTLQIGNGATNGVIGSGAYSVAGGAKMYLNNATATAPPWSQITGAGTLELNSAQAVDGSANWGAPALSNAFTGTLQVDKGRINGIPANLGGATTLAIGNGAQFLVFDGTTNGTAHTFTQNFSANGMGWGEGGQNLGAIRVSGMNATFSGNVTLTGNSGLYTQNAPNTSMTVTGVISDGGSGYGQAINAIGGTITLSNQNTYTGATAVNAGKLVVNGSISTSILTTVASGASLGGSGTVGALTIDSGAFVTPGNSPGILTVNGNYTQAGQYTAEIAGTTAGSGYDQISVTGSVNITGGSLVTQFSGAYAMGDLLFILLNDSTDAITGTYTGLAQGATVTSFGGFDWQISYNANGNAAGSPSFTGGNDIALMAIPEPNVAALIGGFGVLGLLRRRRH